MKFRAGAHVALQVVTPPGTGLEHRSAVRPGAREIVVVHEMTFENPANQSAETEHVTAELFVTLTTVAERKPEVVCEFM
jgi:hypothetical protein